MRLVDLRNAPTPPRVEVAAEASEAAELLRLLGVLVGAEDPGGYDVGRGRIDDVAAELPEGLHDRLRTLSFGDDRVCMSLSIAVARLDDPSDVDELLADLEARPEIPWQLQLSLSTKDWDWEAPDTDSRALADGDPAAIARLREWCEHTDDVPERIHTLLATDPHAYGREVAAVISEVRASVWPALAPEAMGAIERDVAHRRARIAAGDDLATLVLEATNGYVLDEDASIRKVLLLPSYWLRPWLVVDQYDDTLVLSTPVADSFVALPAEAPPPALLKLSKALADEGRLKLLRRMSTGPVSLGEATEQLGVAKATAHHHLSILRQAGLVTMQGDGRSTRYALRLDPAEAARDALSAYVPTGATPAGHREVVEADGVAR